MLELIVVITLLAIISIAAAIVLREPIRGYDDARSRAELTDAADSALRRIGRDLRQALPNSIRVKTVGGSCPSAPCSTFVESLLVRTGGRYRASLDGAGAGDVLNFAASDAAFDTLGPLSLLPGQAIQSNDVVVIFNLNSSAAVTQSNAYTYNQAAGGLNCTSATPSSANCNTARVSGADTAGALPNERNIPIDARQFPQSSAGNRFHVVSGPVSFVCTLPSPALDANGNGRGTLDRVSGYTIAISQPGPAFAGAPVTGRLANFVTACDVQYDAVTSLPTFVGLFTLRLTLTRKSETVTLYQEVHVSNVP